MPVNKIEVKGVDTSGVEKTVYVVRPDYKTLNKATIIQAAAFREASEAGLYLRDQLNEKMIATGMWDDNRQKQLDKLDEAIEENRKKLKNGGGVLKKSEGRELAILIRAQVRAKLLLDRARRKLDSLTADAIAENTKFDFLVSACVKDEEGKNVFNSVDEYKENATEEWAAKAASVLASMLYDFDPDWEKKLPENQFLVKYKFVDENLTLVNDNGQKVTIDGFVINDDGTYTDNDGNKYDLNGELVIEEKPFLDD
jgi:hypothetical protein